MVSWQWLEQQTERQDNVGHLARYLAKRRYSSYPSDRLYGKSKLREYLAVVNAPKRVQGAVEDIFREFSHDLAIKRAEQIAMQRRFEEEHERRKEQQRQEKGAWLKQHDQSLRIDYQEWLAEHNALQEWFATNIRNHSIVFSEDVAVLQRIHAFETYLVNSIIREIEEESGKYIGISTVLSVKDLSFVGYGYEEHEPWKRDPYRIHTTAWRALRKQVLARDGNVCVHCGSTTRLTVHHIVPWGVSQNDDNVNLMTLCGVCHYIVETLPLPQL